jgi:meso-butanediol dehydrogenase/(S,S)-butanediol dehydrogenase/diacetyl reductase
MWETIDAAASERLGIPKGTAFEKSVAERPAMKKASVSYIRRSFLVRVPLTIS